MINQQFAMGFPMVFLGFISHKRLAGALKRCFRRAARAMWRASPPWSMPVPRETSCHGLRLGSNGWKRPGVTVQAGGLAGFSRGNMQFLMQMKNDE